MMPGSETFDQWLEDHRPHAWSITMASDGEQVGIIAECYDCGTVEEFGVIDPIEVMMRHWMEGSEPDRSGNERIARA